MRSQLVRYLFLHRKALKRFMPFRQPVLLAIAGFKMYVRLDDWAVGGRIALNRRYEPHVTAAMLPFLQPGKVVVDIGANIGYYTLLAASRLGSQGKVIAFEPGVDNCALIQMSLRANNFQNTVLHSLAIADVDGVVGFNMDDSNGRISRDNPAVNRYQVQAVTLDLFLQDEPRIDLIKIDIEGAEGRALVGMRRLLQRHHPIIFTEFTPGALPTVSGITAEAFLDLWRELGYDQFILPRAGSRNLSPQSNEDIMAHFAGSPAPDHLDLLLRPRD